MKTRTKKEIAENQIRIQQEIENRAKQINKECYTNQELEVIIFGEIQE